MGKASGRMSSSKPESPLHDASRPIRVLCVDDHAVLVEGLKAQFAMDEHLECVGYLPSANDLLNEVARVKPDVALLDIEMPGADVFEMADRLQHMHRNVRAIFLSAHVRDGYLSAAYKCGAWGYFSKGDELNDIIQGIKDVAQSPEPMFVLGAKVKKHCLPMKPRSAPVNGHAVPNGWPNPMTSLDVLTARETEILRLIGKGRSRQEIAVELSRSPKTVDGHQDRIMKKLGIAARAELMRFAIREGLAEV